MSSLFFKVVVNITTHNVDQYPKVPELWDHRRYVLKSLADTSSLLPKEIKHCYVMCDKYPRNYYSWTTLQMLLPLYTIEQVESNRTA